MNRVLLILFLSIIVFLLMLYLTVQDVSRSLDFTVMFAIGCYIGSFFSDFSERRGE